LIGREHLPSHAFPQQAIPFLLFSSYSLLVVPSSFSTGEIKAFFLCRGENKIHFFPRLSLWLYFLPFSLIFFPQRRWMDWRFLAGIGESPSRKGPSSQSPPAFQFSFFSFLRKGIIILGVRSHSPPEAPFISIPPTPSARRSRSSFPCNGASRSQRAVPSFPPCKPQVPPPLTQESAKLFPIWYSFPRPFFFVPPTLHASLFFFFLPPRALLSVLRVVLRVRDGSFFEANPVPCKMR